MSKTCQHVQRVKFLGALWFLSLPGCSIDPQVGAAQSATADPDPTLTDSERAMLETLSPASLPPSPPDSTNRFADDPVAAALGQQLFSTRIFAGPLLDTVNRGQPGALGTEGETGKVACADCHVPSSDFSDNRSPGAQISLASGWGRRRAPSLLDVGQASLVMWDGRHDTLYNQVFGPLESPVEINSSRLYVAEQIFSHFRAQYESVFGALPPLDDATRFPPVTANVTGCHPSGPIPGQAGGNPLISCTGTWDGYPGDHAEYDSLAPDDQDAVTRVVVNMGKAIGAYERRLACGPSRFDQWMQGDASALSRSEQRGAEVFVGPGRCATCHDGPYFSDQAFHNVGLSPEIVADLFVDSDDHGALVGLTITLADPLNSKSEYSDGDDGRLPSSVTPAAEGAFRTPTLRCTSRRPSFFHTGQALSLEAVVEFYDQGGSPSGFYGGNELLKLNLTALQKADLVAFLRALDGPGAKQELQTPANP